MRAPPADPGPCDLERERVELGKIRLELLELVERGAGGGPLARQDGSSRSLKAMFNAPLTGALLEARPALHRHEGPVPAATAQVGRAGL